MCHHRFTRDRAREPEEEPVAADEDELISPLEDEEPAEDVELLTDGSGDEDE